MLNISKQDMKKSVKDKIVELIKAQGLKPGDKIISQNEMAVYFNIAAPTIYRALSELTCEGILYRIKGKGTYIAEPTSINNAKIQADAISQQCTVGIYPFENYYGNQYLKDLAEGITLGLIKNQLNCKFINRFELELSKASIAEYMYKKGLDGIIFTTINPDEYRYIDELKRNGFAHILINRTYPDSDSVCTDHYGASARLVEMLVSMGHRKIAFVTSNYNIAWVQERLNAYRDVLTKYSIRVDEKLIFNEDTSSDFQCMTDVIANDKSITGLFVSIGAYQKKILEKLCEKNISIPEHLSVVSFDEVPSHSDTCRITCAKQPLLNMGKTAVEVLNKRLRFDTPPPVNVITFEADILIGNSCRIINNLNEGHYEN